MSGLGVTSDLAQTSVTDPADLGNHCCWLCPHPALSSASRNSVTPSVQSPAWAAHRSLIPWHSRLPACMPALDSAPHDISLQPSRTLDSSTSCRHEGDQGMGIAQHFTFLSQLCPHFQATRTTHVVKNMWGVASPILR